MTVEEENGNDDGDGGVLKRRRQEHTESVSEGALRKAKKLNSNGKNGEKTEYETDESITKKAVKKKLMKNVRLLLCVCRCVACALCVVRPCGVRACVRAFRKTKTDFSTRAPESAAAANGHDVPATLDRRQRVIILLSTDHRNRL